MVRISLELLLRTNLFNKMILYIKEYFIQQNLTPKTLIPQIVYLSDLIVY